jgi:hypothetical protein
MGSGAMISLRGRKAMVAKNRMGRKQMSPQTVRTSLRSQMPFSDFAAIIIQPLT